MDWDSVEHNAGDRRFFRLQPDTFSFREVREHPKQLQKQNKDDEKDGDWIDSICVLLSDGDITKRDELLWRYTLRDCGPYLKHRSREILFRECVIGLVTGGEEGAPKETKKELYCRACKAAKKDNCDTCSFIFENDFKR